MISCHISANFDRKSLNLYYIKTHHPDIAAIQKQSNINKFLIQNININPYGTNSQNIYPSQIRMVIQ